MIAPGAEQNGNANPKQEDTSLRTVVIAADGSAILKDEPASQHPRTVMHEVLRKLSTPNTSLVDLKLLICQEIALIAWEMSDCADRKKLETYTARVNTLKALRAAVFS